jgi:hypothetical protein
MVRTSGGDITCSRGFPLHILRIRWSRALHTVLPYRSAYSARRYSATASIIEDRFSDGVAMAAME